MSLKNDKLTVWLLLVAVVASVVGNVYSVAQTEATQKNQDRMAEDLTFSMNAIVDHNEAVKIHAAETAATLNKTDTLLQTLIEDIQRTKDREAKLTDPFLQNFTRMMESVRENNRILEQIVNQTAPPQQGASTQ